MGSTNINAQGFSKKLVYIFVLQIVTLVLSITGSALNQGSGELAIYLQLASMVFSLLALASWSSSRENSLSLHILALLMMTFSGAFFSLALLFAFPLYNSWNDRTSILE